jgi:hypothetical protein
MFQCVLVGVTFVECLRLRLLERATRASAIVLSGADTILRHKELPTLAAFPDPAAAVPHASLAGWLASIIFGPSIAMCHELMNNELSLVGEVEYFTFGENPRMT